MFGSRRSLELTVKPTDPSLVPQAMDEARVALRIARKLQPRDKDNFGLVTSDTLHGSLDELLARAPSRC